MTSTPIPFIDLTYSTLAIENDFLAAVAQILRENTYIQGARVRDFEVQFAEYLISLGAPSNTAVVSVANGTDALEIAAATLDINPGDEVITTPFTFAAPIEAILRRGATPILCDINPHTLLLNLDDSLHDAITPKTKAILPVHLFGKTCDPQPLLDLKKQHHIKILEDAAQAHGSYYITPLDKPDLTATPPTPPVPPTPSASSTPPPTPAPKIYPAATFGDVATFSFFPTKNLGAFGDAGAIVSQDPHILESARLIANHGCKQKYHHLRLGQNSRLDAIQAAALSLKLPHLNSWNQRRREIAHLYRQRLLDIPSLATTSHAPGDVYHHFVIRILEGEKIRSKLVDFLGKHGVKSNIYYPRLIQQQSAFQSRVRCHGPLTQAYIVTTQVLALPCYPGLDDQQIHRICDLIHLFFNP